MPYLMGCRTTCERRKITFIVGRLRYFSPGELPTWLSTSVEKTKTSYKSKSLM
jgi:hypothetical protein